MQGCTSSIVDVVNVHALDPREVVQGARLVALRSDVQHISTVDILHVDVCSHFIDHHLDELEVAVVSREVESRELLVGRLVDPLDQCFPIVHNVDVECLGVSIY